MFNIHILLNIFLKIIRYLLTKYFSWNWYLVKKEKQPKIISNIPNLYSNSYLNYYQVPLTLKKNLDKFSDWEDINKPGIKFAVTLGTVQEQMAKEFFPKAIITSIEAPARDFQEVLSGRALVSMTSNIEAAALVVQYKELAIIPVKEQRKPTPLAWLMPQNDQVWINYINHWIELKKSQGFFREMKIKWNLN